MKYLIFNHQNKAADYIDALNASYEMVEGDYPGVDFVFTDNDVRGRRSHLRRLRSAGATCFFVYPHAAGPNLVNDINTPWRYTTACFVATEGHAEIMRRYGYPRPIHAVGWHLCKIRKFHPKRKPYQVLFAPIHPRCALDDKKLNRATFEKLRPLAEAGRIELTVRHIDKLEKCGLQRVEHEQISYHDGKLEPSTWHIDRADVVVGHQTFAYLAVARGIPTVMMGEDMPPHLVPKGKPVVYVNHWDDYVDLMSYPLDIMKHKNTYALLERAAQGSMKVEAWKERMIGEPFDGDKLLEIVADYLADPPNPAPIPVDPELRKKRLQFGRNLNTVRR